MLFSESKWSGSCHTWVICESRFLTHCSEVFSHAWPYSVEMGRRRFGQAHRTSAERSAELRPNVVC